MLEMQVRSLGWEDSLEAEMATHSKYSCLGSSMDRGAWWATVHGVAESWQGARIALSGHTAHVDKRSHREAVAEVAGPKSLGLEVTELRFFARQFTPGFRVPKSSEFNIEEINSA